MVERTLVSGSYHLLSALFNQACSNPDLSALYEYTLQARGGIAAAVAPLCLIPLLSIETETGKALPTRLNALVILIGPRAVSEMLPTTVTSAVA